MRILLAAYLAALALMGGIAITGGILLFRDSGPDDAVESAAANHGYSLAEWELTQFPRKWLYEVTHLFDSRGRAEEDEALRLYFALAATEGQRGPLENEVEDIIEGRVTSILEDEGLALEPPLFRDLGLIFPPVDFELDTPPRLLVISTRDRIALDHSHLLSPGLDADTVAAIEAAAEAENAANTGVSALVINTGGVAAYPSIVSELASYESLIDTVFHEWLHQYLIFFPLGRDYTRSSETRTLNESVANIGGSELARLYFERYGNPAADVGAGFKPAPTPAMPTEFDFTAEMRALRRTVEELLAKGEITQAEALMAAKRDEFEAQGVFIRKLNQAYFAFHGFYADSPGSIDPIGPKLQTLFERSGSPGAFVRAAAGITRVSELDSALN